MGVHESYKYILLSVCFSVVEGIVLNVINILQK